MKKYVLLTIVISSMQLLVADRELTWSGGMVSFQVIMGKEADQDRLNLVFRPGGLRTSRNFENERKIGLSKGEYAKAKDIALRLFRNHFDLVDGTNPTKRPISQEHAFVLFLDHNGSTLSFMSEVTPEGVADAIDLAEELLGENNLYSDFSDYVLYDNHALHSTETSSAE